MRSPSTSTHRNSSSGLAPLHPKNSELQIEGRILHLKKFVRSGLLVGGKDVTGFTLIEVLVVMALFAILASFGLFLSMDFYRSYSFRSERNILVSVLGKARNQSLINLNQAIHGVRIEGDQYTIFETFSDYANRVTAFDEIVNTQPTITISSNPSLPYDVIFSQLSGDVATPGTITISDGARSSNITINNEGQINW